MGLPIDYRGVCKIYPPKVKDIVDNPKALQLFKLLTYSQEEIEDLFDEKPSEELQEKRIPTPLEFVLINSYYNKEFKELVKEAFQFFIHEDVTMLFENKIILIGNAEDLVKIKDIKQFRYLNEDNFFDFQNIVRETMGLKALDRPDPNCDPMIKRIKKKVRYRERMKAKNSKKGISLTTTLAAICCMGIGITPLNIGEMSYASINVITTLYQQKEKYQTDIDSLMAGADPKKVHPKYWIREDPNYVEVKI